MDPITCTSSYSIHTSKEKGSFQDTVKVKAHSNTLCPDMKSLFQTAFQSHATRWKLIIFSSLRISTEDSFDVWEYFGHCFVGFFFTKVTNMLVSRLLFSLKYLFLPAKGSWLNNWMAAIERAEGSGWKMRADTGTTTSSWPGACLLLPTTAVGSKW